MTDVPLVSIPYYPSSMGDPLLLSSLILAEAAVVNQAVLGGGGEGGSTSNKTFVINSQQSQIDIIIGKSEGKSEQHKKPAIKRKGAN